MNELEVSKILSKNFMEDTIAYTGQFAGSSNYTVPDEYLFIPFIN